MNPRPRPSAYRERRGLDVLIVYRLSSVTVLRVASPIDVMISLADDVSTSVPAILFLIRLNSVVGFGVITRDTPLRIPLVKAFVFMLIVHGTSLLLLSNYRRARGIVNASSQSG